MSFAPYSSHMENRPAARQDWRNILILLLLNPACYTLVFGITTGGYFPDSPAYLTLAKEMVAHGLLVLKGWGHVDSGLILPPLYPLLIALGQFFRDDAMLNAMLISNVATLASSIFLYFLLCRLTTRMFAFVGCLVFQFSNPMLLYGTSVMAEALFVSILLGFFLLYARMHADGALNIRQALALGGIAGLLFLTRQIGGVLCISFVSLYALSVFRGYLAAKATVAIILPFLIGFAAVFGIYAIPLYLQTGKTPLVQHFRLGSYTVVADNDSLSPAPLARTVEYTELFAARREAAQLRPDAKEMIGAQITSGRASETSFPSLNEWVGSVGKNITLMGRSQGYAFVVLFLASCLLLLFGGAFLKILNAGDVAIPMFCLIYLALLSLLTAAIDRYLVVLFPAALVVILHGIHAVFGFFPRVFNWAKNSVILLLGGVLMVLSPQTIANIKISRQVSEVDLRQGPCASVVPAGAPIFSILPMQAYALGGVARTLPNDSLDKIRLYAAATGVEWLSMRAEPASQQIATYYSHASWINSIASIHELDPHFVLRCRDNDGTVAIYSILHN